MNTFALKILAADRVFYDGPCLSLVIPTSDGQYGILANHENAIVAIHIGLAKLTDGEGVRHQAVLSTGVCKIENNEVIVLVETAERPEEIDRVQAEREAADAREKLRNQNNTTEIKRAKAKMARAAIRLRAKSQREID